MPIYDLQKRQYRPPADFFSAFDTSRPLIMWYYIEYQPFGADAKYRVPTMQNRLGDLTQPP